MPMMISAFTYKDKNMKTVKKNLLALSIAAFLTPMVVHAQTNNDGYLQDSSGHIVRSGTGLCWHTSEYDANKTKNPECDTMPQEKVVEKQVVQTEETPKPIEQPPVVIPKESISHNETILFAFDSDKIRPEEAQKLDALIHRDGPAFDRLTINIVGYTDPIGGEVYNMKLSKRRAWAVLNYLKSHGVDVTNVDVSWKGKHDLVVVDCKKGDIPCNQPNRRTEITIKE